MRFKKMHMAIMVIALGLVLGSVQMAPKGAAATAGVQYYYNFEPGHYSGKTTIPSDWVQYVATEYKWNGYSPTNNIEFQKWIVEYKSSSNFINSIALQGMAQPPLRNTITSRPDTGSYSLRLWDKSGTPSQTGIHANDTADRSQFNLIPDGHDGFHHLDEFYVGYSMMIPLGNDYFSPNSNGQWVALFNLHTKPGNASFTINLASTPDSVTEGSVLLKGATWTLTDPDNPDCSSGPYCPVQHDEQWFYDRMDRGVWYDFLLQFKMSDRGIASSNTGHVYVRMKKSSEKWDTNPNDGVDQYGHMVYSYTGPVGWADGDDITHRYYPFINIYRSQHPFPTDANDHDRDNNHLIYVDEIRVGVGGAGASPGAVIVPGSFK